MVEAGDSSITGPTEVGSRFYFFFFLRFYANYLTALIRPASLRRRNEQPLRGRAGRRGRILLFRR